MEYRIPHTNIDLKPGQYIIRRFHEVPKCYDWWSSHGLVLRFQEGKAVIFYNQICHGGLNILTILDRNGSYG